MGALLKFEGVHSAVIYEPFTDILDASLYTQIEMIDPTTNNNLLSSLAQKTNPLSGLNGSSSTSDLSSSFAQILSSSMMSGGMGSSGSGSGDSSGSSGMTGMLMPLMMMLLEQILAQQTADQTTQTSSAPTPQSAVSTPQAATGANTALYNEAGANGQPVGRPVGGVITQGYSSKHIGIDFGVPLGTNVKSTMSGQVVHAGWNNEGYGNLVIVQNGPYRTYYAHLSSVPVKVGDTVNAGQVIGLSGSTGNSTGPHVHYEVRLDGKAIDPTSRTLTSGKTW